MNSKLNSVFIFSALIFLSLNSIAQCKFDKEEKDPFSGEMNRSFVTGIGKFGWNWKMEIGQKGKNKYFGLTIKWNGKFEDVMEKGRKIMLKLENNKILELALNNDYPGTYVTGEGYITSIYYPQCDLSEEQLSELSKSPIALLKASIGGKDQLPDISTKSGKQVMAIAKCLMGK